MKFTWFKAAPSDECQLPGMGAAQGYLPLRHNRFTTMADAEQAARLAEEVWEMAYREGRDTVRKRLREELGL